ERYHVYAEGFEIQTHQHQAIPLLHLIYVEDGPSQLQLQFNYGPHTFTAGAENKVTVRMEYNEKEDLYIFHRVKRSLQWEEQQLENLKALGLEDLDRQLGLLAPTMQSEKRISVFDWINNHQEQIKALGFQ